MNRAMLLSAILALVAVRNVAVFADDFAPPSWRGLPRTTTQGWDFLTPQDPIQPDDPNVPLVIGNGGGVPLVSYGAMSWVPLDGDGGVQSITSASQFNVYIPNWIDLLPIKTMWVQITFVGNPADAPYITNIGGHDNLNTYVSVVPDPPVVFPLDPFSGVTGLGLGFTFYPNPDWETFDLVVPVGITIDQIVIDTISFPEPASLALLATGGLALIARRR